MNFGKYAPYLDLLYNDRMDIYRHKEKTDDDGVTQSYLPDEPVYSDIPCLMTTKQADMPESGDQAYNEYEVLGSVYCKNSWGIQKGDILKIRRIDSGKQYAEFSGLASHPSINTLCQKTLVLDKKKAVQYGV